MAVKCPIKEGHTEAKGRHAAKGVNEGKGVHRSKGAHRGEHFKHGGGRSLVLSHFQNDGAAYEM